MKKKNNPTQTPEIKYQIRFLAAEIQIFHDIFEQPEITETIV